MQGRNTRAASVRTLVLHVPPPAALLPAAAASAAAQAAAAPGKHATRAGARASAGAVSSSSASSDTGTALTHPTTAAEPAITTFARAFKAFSATSAQLREAIVAECGGVRPQKKGSSSAPLRLLYARGALDSGELDAYEATAERRAADSHLEALHGRLRKNIGQNFWYMIDKVAFPTTVDVSNDADDSGSDAEGGSDAAAAPTALSIPVLRREQRAAAAAGRLALTASGAAAASTATAASRKRGPPPPPPGDAVSAAVRQRRLPLTADQLRQAQDAAAQLCADADALLAAALSAAVQPTLHKAHEKALAARARAVQQLLHVRVGRGSYASPAEATQAEEAAQAAVGATAVAEATARGALNSASEKVRAAWAQYDAVKETLDAALDDITFLRS